MKTVSDSRIFIDTNILYYTNDPIDPLGKQAVNRINQLASGNNQLIISSQIIREYAYSTIRNAIYHKLPLSASIAGVLNNIAKFYQDFEILYDDEDVMRNFLLLLPSLTSYKDIFDFNIAASLRTHSIKYILTNNASDFTKFNDWLTILPLFPTA